MAGPSTSAPTRGSTEASACRHRLAEHPDLTARGSREPEQQPNRRRLAGSVGSEEAEHRAAWNRQIEGVDDALAAEGLRQPGGLDGETVTAPVIARGERRSLRGSLEARDRHGAGQDPPVVEQQHRERATSAGRDRRRPVSSARRAAAPNPASSPSPRGVEAAVPAGSSTIDSHPVPVTVGFGESCASC